MQREREDRDDFFKMGDPFSSFGTHRSMMPSLFGGRDPFDDPFFSRPFDSMFGTSGPSIDAPPANKSKGIVIEELNSDDEGVNEESEEDKGTGDKRCIREKHSISSREPSVEHPDDEAIVDKTKDVNTRNNHIKAEGAKPQVHGTSFRSCKVTYGGIDGAYYSSSRTRRTGSNGVVHEETKEADRTKGQATHTISRGIHDKGHSVTKKLDSDGKVDTLQTLHNLNEDELSGFEAAWKADVKGRLPGWNDDLDMHGSAGSGSKQKGKATLGGGWALPSAEQQARTAGGTGLDTEPGVNPSAGRTKNVVRINIE